MRQEVMVGMQSARPGRLSLVPARQSLQQGCTGPGNGITCDDAAAAVGLNPLKSRLELWVEKTGAVAPPPQPDHSDEFPPDYWSTLLKPIVAAHYTRRTGRPARRARTWVRHREHCWMQAFIGWEVIGNAEVQGLDCLTPIAQQASRWDGGVPQEVLLSVLHRLAVTGWRAIDLAVLLDHSVQIHRVERDEAEIASLITREREFWECVRTRRQPPADGSSSAGRALASLYPQASGQILDFRGDSAISAAFDDLVAVRRVLREHATMEVQLTQRIQQAMGHASEALFEGGEVTWDQPPMPPAMAESSSRSFVIRSE